jgi:ADP-ribose pyrophosphatase YjhB (NUDIX family)
METVVVTGILVRNTKGQLLLVKKPADVGPYSGMYLPPGGNVERNEPVDEAALRELYEETGVKVKNLKRVYFDDNFTEDWQGRRKHFIGLLYTADYESGNLQPTEEDDDKLEVIRWFSPGELHDLPLSPPLASLLDVAGYPRD